jgi:hypothetical protein
MAKPDRSAYDQIIGPDRRAQIIAAYTYRLAALYHLTPSVAERMATDQYNDGLAEPIASAGQVWETQGAKGAYRFTIEERGYGRSMVGGMWVSFGGGLTSLASLNESYQLVEWDPSLPLVPPTPLHAEDNYVLRAEDEASHA